MPLRCPVCRAENSSPPSCRRCKVDLSLLFDLERSRDYLLHEARQHLRAWRRQAALQCAERANALREDETSLQLFGLASLLCGDHPQAWRILQRLAQRRQG